MYFVLMAGWSIFWTSCVIAMSGIGKYEWKGLNTVTHQERNLYRPTDEDELAA